MKAVAAIFLSLNQRNNPIDYQIFEVQNYINLAINKIYTRY